MVPKEFKIWEANTKRAENLFYITSFKIISLADPGFSRGRNANPKGGGAKLIFWPISLKICVKTKTIWNESGGVSPWHPLESANAYWQELTTP